MTTVGVEQELLTQLEVIGTKRREHKRLRSEAAALAREFIPAALEAGVTVSEISRRTDLTRDAVYSILGSTTTTAA